MHTRIALFVILVFPIVSVRADNGNIGADYAFLTLMTLEPEFSAARYKIDSENGDTVDIRIARLPIQKKLGEYNLSRWDFETAIAYQNAHESFHYLPSYRNEYVDSYWTTKGVSFGLLYSRRLSQQLIFSPSFRVGVAELENKAYYYGPLTNLLKDGLQGSLLGWTTDVSVANLGIGLDYRWNILDRASHLKSNISHIVVNSFHEQSAQASFHEKANLISSSADIIFPSQQRIKNKRIDYILLLGNDYFIGENRHTLGYVTSFQLGIGAELPFRLWQDKTQHIRFSFLGQWASVMRSWTVSISYNE